MAYMWTVLVGYILTLAVIGGVFIHFLQSALTIEDSVRIDPLPKDSKKK